MATYAADKIATWTYVHKFIHWISNVWQHDILSFLFHTRHVAKERYNGNSLPYLI